MWYVLAFAGAGALWLSSFCLDIFPSWASFVRKMRLLDARMSGAMRVSAITKYEEREDKRTSDITDKVTESFSRVGQDIVSLRSQVAENDSKMNEIIKTLEAFKAKTQEPNYLKQVEDSMKTMSKKIERYSDFTNSAIRDLQNQIAIGTKDNNQENVSVESENIENKDSSEINVITEKSAEKNTEINKIETSEKSKGFSKKSKKEERMREAFGESKNTKTSEDVTVQSVNTDTITFPDIEDDLVATKKDYDEINKSLDINAVPTPSSDASNLSTKEEDPIAPGIDESEKEIEDYFS